MPICVIWEKRHHLGQSDIAYPAVFCDLCGLRIEDAKEGNYSWANPPEGQDWYAFRAETFFCHKRCGNRFKPSSNPSRVRLHDGRVVSSAIFSEYPWGPLEDYPIFMAVNLHIATNVTLHKLLPEAF